MGFSHVPISNTKAPWNEDILPTSYTDGAQDVFWPTAYGDTTKITSQRRFYGSRADVTLLGRPAILGWCSLIRPIKTSKLYLDKVPGRDDAS